MRWTERIRARLRWIIRRKRLERDLDAELQFHYEQHVEEQIAAGLGVEEARASALRAFGSVNLVKDQCRDAMGVTLVDHLARDVRYAIRTLRRSPAFAATAILTLALGVGANVAVFSVVNAVLLRPLPYANGDDLVILKHRDQRTGITKEFIAIGDYVDVAGRQQAFSQIGAYGSRPATVYNMGEPFRVSVLLATSGVFAALGIVSVTGRALEPDDSRPGSARVAVIGYQMWQQRFGAVAGVIGRGIRVDGDDYQIVGVAPAGFQFPPTAATDLILPQPIPLQAPASRQSNWTFAVARLKPGIPLEAAAVNLSAISGQLAEEYPVQNHASQYFVVPLRDALVGSSKTTLVLLLAAVGLLLLIACANVANLMLARSLSRRPEMAVRLALGANHRHLAAQLAAESLVLALAAAAVGALIAQWGATALVALVPRSIVVPGLSDVRVNVIVLAFTLGLTIATALVFGLVSALTTRSESGTGALVASRLTMGRVARRAASALVAVEVALAIVLLVGAGLILRTFARLSYIDPGFRVDGVMTVTAAVPADRYRDVPARQAFYARALQSLRALPDVAAVGVAQVTPLTGNNWTIPFERADQPVGGGQRPPDVGWQAASAGYFAAMQIPLLSGRLFNDGDLPHGPRVVIVSHTIERRFFPGESAVGRKVNLGRATAEIIGVVGDIRRAALSDEPRPDLYESSEQNPVSPTTWFVRTATDPARLLPLVQTSLRTLEPNIVTLDPRSMADVAKDSMQGTYLAVWLLGLFAVTALALAAVGAYGVMSYVIRQRTREIGMRVALGATRSDIVRLVMRQGAVIAATGTVLGLGIALVAGRFLEALLYGVTARDPATLTIASAVLVVTILIACYVPARRAGLIDPARTIAEP
jgi:predicted permease